MSENVTDEIFAELAKDAIDKSVDAIFQNFEMLLNYKNVADKDAIGFVINFFLSTTISITCTCIERIHKGCKSLTTSEIGAEFMSALMKAIADLERVQTNQAPILNLQIYSCTPTQKTNLAEVNKTNDDTTH